MTASTILHRATLTPPRMVVGRRLNSAASATPTPRSRPSKGQGMNQPKAIFWGWFGLVVVAGLGYFTVKSNNTAKKREFMVKQGQELQQKNAMLNEDGEPAATTTPVLMSSSNQEKYAQSPLQSLAAAFNRQTSQRSRKDMSSSNNLE